MYSYFTLSHAASDITSILSCISRPTVQEPIAVCLDAYTSQASSITETSNPADILDNTCQ